MRDVSARRERLDALRKELLDAWSPNGRMDGVDDILANMRALILAPLQAAQVEFIRQCYMHGLGVRQAARRGGIARDIVARYYNSFGRSRDGINVTAMLMGDPAPGRSALDERRGTVAQRSIYVPDVIAAPEDIPVRVLPPCRHCQGVVFSPTGECVECARRRGVILDVKPPPDDRVAPGREPKPLRERALLAMEAGDDIKPDERVAIPGDVVLMVVEITAEIVSSRVVTVTAEEILTTGYNGRLVSRARVYAAEALRLLYPTAYKSRIAQALGIPPRKSMDYFSTVVRQAREHHAWWRPDVLEDIMKTARERCQSQQHQSSST